MPLKTNTPPVYITDSFSVNYITLFYQSSNLTFYRQIYNSIINNFLRLMENSYVMRYLETCFKTNSRLLMLAKVQALGLNVFG